MISDKPIHAKEILDAAKNILLIDWPNADVPGVLLEKGFTVFCYSPGRYTRAQIEKDRLVFQELDRIPGPIDIVIFIGLSKNIRILYHNMYYHWEQKYYGFTRQ